jgi:hypothetical protein
MGKDHLRLSRNIDPGASAELTCTLESITHVVDAVHAARARVAAHSTMSRWQRGDFNRHFDHNLCVDGRQAAD